MRNKSWIAMIALPLAMAALALTADAQGKSKGQGAEKAGQGKGQGSGKKKKLRSLSRQQKVLRSRRSVDPQKRAIRRAPRIARRSRLRAGTAGAKLTAAAGSAALHTTCASAMCGRLPAGLSPATEPRNS